MAVGSQAPAVTNPTWLSAATVGQEEHQRMGEVVVGHDVWGKGRASGAAGVAGGVPEDPFHVPGSGSSKSGQYC